LSKFIGKNPPDLIPLSTQPIAFLELFEKGSIPKECLLSEYTAQQFVERLVHYVLSVPNKSFQWHSFPGYWNSWTQGYRSSFLKG